MSRPRLSGPRIFRTLRNRRASAAVEFACVSLSFLTILLFTIEVSYDLFLQTTLDETLQTAARQIQVGNAATVSSAAAFQSAFLCPAANGRLSCDALSVNVTAIATDYYTQGGTTLPQADGKVDPTQLRFCEGQPGQLMLVTAVYTSASLVGSLVPGMSTATVNGVRHVTTSSTAFVNEPWPVTYTPGNAC